MQPDVGFQSICKNFCLNNRRASFEKLINRSLQNPTLHTLQRGFVYACVGFAVHLQELNDEQ